MDSRHLRWKSPTTGATAGLAGALPWLVLLATVLPAPAVLGARVTPESPEVKELIQVGLERMKREAGDEIRLGGKCIIALALVKLGESSDGLVSGAVSACRRSLQSDKSIDIYSNGIAIIFLCEAGPKRYRSEIQGLLNRLMEQQKPHGGWGYEIRKTGDTSQTQYAALALWEAHRNGFKVDPAAVARLSDWLMRTQAPNGAWGYQGNVGESDRAADQTQVTPCMGAAGLGSTLICSDLLGGMPMSENAPAQQADFEIPAALRTADDEQVTTEPLTTDIDYSRFAPAIEAGNDWMDDAMTIRVKKYQNYYLYALERYKSFQELYDGLSPASPDWYQRGYEFLKQNQLGGGGWEDGCKTAVDCAFSVLFLYRSTQKIIRASLGEGSLTAGRGLPANVADATLRQGQIVVQKVATELDDMLSLVDDEQADKLDQLASNPASLKVDKLDENSARRLQQLVRAPEPSTRRLAVRALARSGNLDFVPTLIFALTDPDTRVVLEARNGLRFVSRRFEGFGLPASFNEQQRSEVIERWKQWYLTLHPDTVFEQ